MKIAGYLKRDNAGFVPLFPCNGFKSIVENREFNLFGDFKDSDKCLLYNFREGIHLILLGYITNMPHRYQNILDTIIDDYLLKGAGCFDSMDGAYVVILWDEKARTLYITRDIYGIKLLYYYFSHEHGLTFSNNLDTLVRITGQKNISHKALHEYLRFLDISPPYTIYENVYFLKPGEIIVANGREIILEGVSACSPLDVSNGLSLKDAVKEFKNLFCESIEKRMRNARNVGVFLSGGIDSTLICALTSKLKDDIKAYTVGFEDQRYDESKTAQDIARYLGVKHQLLRFTLKDDHSIFYDFVSNISSPFADPAVIPTLQCFRSVSGSIDVALDGTGGDSLIGIMPARHIRFVLKYLQYIPYRLKMFLKKCEVLFPYSVIFDFKKAVELLIRWQGWTEEEISLLCNIKCDLSYTSFYRLFDENSRKEPYELYSTLIGATPNDRQHQTAHLFGLDIAFPFWDRNVQEFVKKLPMEYKCSNGISKILFKRLLEEYIPPNIWDKPKHSFDYPFEQLLRYDKCKLARSFLSKDAVNEHMLFIPFVVERYLQRFLDGDDSIKFKIWALVVFQAWYFNYYKQL